MNKKPEEKIKKVRSFMIEDKEWEIVRLKAAKYADGNISRLIRKAISNYHPRKENGE